MVNASIFKILLNDDSERYWAEMVLFDLLLCTFGAGSIRPTLVTVPVSSRLIVEILMNIEGPFPEVGYFADRVVNDFDRHGARSRRALAARGRCSAPAAGGTILRCDLSV